MRGRAETSLLFYHFSLGRSFFYPHTPKDEGLSNRGWGGGGSLDFFFQKAHKILTLQTNFSKEHTENEPLEFHFS